MEFFSGGSRFSEVSEGGENNVAVPGKKAMDRFYEIMGDGNADGKEGKDIPKLTPEQREEKFNRMFESQDFQNDMGSDIVEDDEKQPKGGGGLKETDKAEEGLRDGEKENIREQTGWAYEIIDNIKNMKQYEILRNAGLVEAEINGKRCLVKKKIDLDYTDEDGISNRDRMERGLAPIDEKTGKPLELHHLGQKADSPLVELTQEEHRTGEYEDGRKNQSLWHDNTVETEVHGEGNNWDHERNAHWKSKAENNRG